ncbi:MAG: DUF4340 domain-containing protein [Oscillospiraceae bacterium]|nr:DUF4340 domain-containing protein [Candidatus Equicaccousia limihippi]
MADKKKKIDTAETENAEVLTENTEIAQTEQDEQSTIFSQTTGDDIKPPRKKKKNRALTLIILAAVAVILAGVLCLYLFVFKEPEEKVEDPSADVITVIDFSADELNKIEVENQSGKLLFTNTVTKDADGNKQSNWVLNGYDKDLIASTSISALAGKVAMLSAVKEMPVGGNYGLEKPSATVTAYKGGETYKIYVGNNSPDKSGNYIKTSLSDKIYFVLTSDSMYFNYAAEDYSDNTIVNALDTSTVSDGYLTSTSSLDHIDSLDISGKTYPQAIKIRHTDNTMAAYRMIEPRSHYADADTVSAAVAIIDSGMVATGAYKFNPTAKDINAYGLNNPDIIVKITYDNKTISFKATKYDDTYYALMLDGKNAIYKFLASDLFTYKAEDYYNNFAFLQEISEFSKVDFIDGNGTRTVTIDYDTEENTTTEYYAGKEIDDDLFRTYYYYFTNLKPSVEGSSIGGKSVYTAVFTYRDKSAGNNITIQFKKHNDRQYEVIIDGNYEGLINYTYFDCIKNYLDKVIKGESIPDPE